MRFVLETNTQQEARAVASNATMIDKVIQETPEIRKRHCSTSQLQSSCTQPQATVPECMQACDTAVGLVNQCLNTAALVTLEDSSAEGSVVLPAVHSEFPAGAPMLSSTCERYDAPGTAENVDIGCQTAAVADIACWVCCTEAACVSIVDAVCQVPEDMLSHLPTPCEQEHSALEVTEFTDRSCQTEDQDNLELSVSAQVLSSLGFRPSFRVCPCMSCIREYHSCESVQWSCPFSYVSSSWNL